MNLPSTIDYSNGATQCLTFPAITFFGKTKYHNYHKVSPIPLAQHFEPAFRAKKHRDRLQIKRVSRAEGAIQSQSPQVYKVRLLLPFSKMCNARADWAGKLRNTARRADGSRYVSDANGPIARSRQGASARAFSKAILFPSSFFSPGVSINWRWIFCLRLSLPDTSGYG